MAQIDLVTLSVSQMIDQAIGTPEIGVVNFNMLQALLHCIVQQLNIQNKHVELRNCGVPGQTGTPQSTVAIAEFVVDGQAGVMKQVQKTPTKDETILIAERMKGVYPVAPGTPGFQEQAAETFASGLPPPGQYQGAAPGTQRTPGAQVAPGAPGQFQAGAPGQVQGGAPGQFQGGAPGAPGQVQEGAPGQYQQGAPGAAPGQYQQGTPGAAPGQYQQGASGTPGQGGPPGAPVQYQQGAPGAAPGQYQQGTPGAPGQGGPPGAPGQYQQGAPGAPGQGGPPGAPGQVGSSYQPGAKLQMSKDKLIKTPSGQELSIVTLSKFNILADAVDDLRQKVYATLPKNEAILEGVRTASNEKAITDMWSTLNVQGRLDAAENGITKLSSLLQDLIKDTPELQRQTSKIQRAAAIATEAITPRSQAQAARQGQPGVQYVQGPPGAPGQAPGAPGQVQYVQGPPAAPGQAPGAPGQVQYVQGPPGAPGQAPGAPGQVQYVQGPPAAPGQAPGAPGQVQYVQGPPAAPGQAPGAPGQVQYVQGPPGAPGQAPGAPGQVQYVQGPPAAPGQAPGAPGQVQYVQGPPGAPGQAPGAPGQVQYVQGPPAAPGQYVQGGPGVQPGQPGAPGQPQLGSADRANATIEPPAAFSKYAAFASGDPKGGFADMDTGDLKAIANNIKDLRKDVDNLYVLFYRTMDDCGIQPTETGAQPSTALAHSMTKAIKQIDQENVAQASGQPGAASTGASLPAKKGGFKSGGGGAAGGGGSFEISDLCARLFDLDRKMNQCCENIDKNGALYQDKVDRLEDHVDYVLKQMGINTNAIKKTNKPDVTEDLQSLMQLFQTVQGMQDQLRQVHDTAMALAAEKEQRQYHINTLLEQVELLKVIKMDREDMAEAMAEKADIRMLQRKVSHDQFEMACDDLAKGLEHAIGKLNLQDALWQQALDDIQREIETKLDKMELSPVKEFFNKKLKQLQENLKQLSQLRREVEAAGTKRKLLKDVNCISCDANVVMPMENGPCLPASKPVTAMHSMKPYLTYELDSIRKTQASHLAQRNMHDWEAIDKQMGHQKPLLKVRSDTNKHICNRYCGGSHTVTTPAQRVARVGHFVKQWGPDVLPLSSGLAAGDDGKMYKVTNVETANVGPGGAVPQEVCTPKLKKTSDTKLARGPVIANECRCLEAADKLTKDGKESRPTSSKVSQNNK